MIRKILSHGLAVPARRFAAETRGTMLTEFVIVLPILLWAWLGMFTFWDTYATMNRVQKTSFVVSDALSRSTGEVDEDYLNGLTALMDYMIDGDTAPRTRYTSVGWNPTTQRYFVMWSYSPGGAMVPLTSGTLTLIEQSLPVLVNLETVLVVETAYDYRPVFSPFTVGDLEIGMEDMTFTQTVVTRPRFVIKVCKDGIDCGAVS